MHANVTRALTDSWVWTWHQILQALPVPCPLSYHHFWTCSLTHTHTHTLKLCFAPLFNSFPRLPFCLFVFNFPLNLVYLSAFLSFQAQRERKLHFSLLVVNEKSTSRFHPCFFYFFLWLPTAVFCHVPLSLKTKIEEKVKQKWLSGKECTSIFLIMVMLFVLRVPNLPTTTTRSPISNGLVYCYPATTLLFLEFHVSKMEVERKEIDGPCS